MRIVSWNIQWGRGADGCVDLTRTLGVLRRLGADVICLQEVAVNLPGLPGGVIEDGCRILCEGMPDYTPVFAPAVDVAVAGGGRGQFGNLILSRLPVDQVWRHLLPWPADARVPSMQRGCVEVVIRQGSESLRVLTTHLEYYAAGARLAQTERLAELQQEVCALEAAPPLDKERNAAFATRPRPSRAVLCGDFNCRPGDAAYRALLAGVSSAPWRDAWSALHGELAHAHTVGLHGAEWPSEPFCCDYFLVSANLQSALRGIEVCADTAASDHQPLVLDLF
ncbi:endonuclease/exonuclease/phosphatase family protein [Niveibacterium sp.]|uniref:endonuclease/exonuclease/phosphatase family protein n=1 Tax=Niveibacterium sp. TaxID=2017444 RepID=UPI0035B148E4